MFSRLAFCHGEHGNVAPWSSSSSAVDVGPEASSDEYVGVDRFIGVIEVGIHIAVVVWHGGASCIGIICRAGEDVGSSKDKECDVPICMGDVESCGAPTRIGIVLHTGNPLLKPGARLAAVGVCSMALGTLPGPMLACDWVVAGDIGMGASSRGGMLVGGDEAGDGARIW